MRAIKTGNKIKIYDDSLKTFDKLPAATYMVSYSQMEGCFLTGHPNISVTEKTYGVHGAKVVKVLKSFELSRRSLGVILSGDKGIGKSLFAKLLCETAIDKGIPVLIVDSCVPGVARFIESIDQECVVLFDEFDKIFRSNRNVDDQAGLLSLFDGTAGGKKLYVVTCNELYGLNDYIVNRPGRFHYHFRFEYPNSADIREYLYDKLNPEYYGEIDKVIAFSHKISLNYDCLRAIAFELNQGVDFKEAANDLNILNINYEEYNITLLLDNGQTLHQYRYRINLFDNDRTYNWATMYDENGVDVADLRIDKTKLSYDPVRNVITIIEAGLYLDFSDYDSVDEKYKNAKPLQLTFRRCGMRNLHYTV